MNYSIIETDKLNFKFIPGFAAFLLKEKFEDFVKVSLQLSREENLPILKNLTSYSEEQLMELGKFSNTELLTALAQNNVRPFIENSLTNWVTNRLVIIDKDQIATEDITLGAYIRRKIFRSFLKEYTTDEASMQDIIEELDRFTTESELLTYNAYINFQQEKLKKINLELSEHEARLLEAQELAEMGSFLWDMTDPTKSVYTAQVMKIFGMSTSSILDSFIQHVHPADQILVKSAIERSLTVDGIYECEYRYIKNGSEKKIWSKGIVEFENNKPVKMKGFIRDVTKKHQMMEQLKSLNLSLTNKNIELERTNKELESFNYIASHDLQEPLRKIQTFTNRLTEHKADIPKVAIDYIEKINSSSLRMQTLIQDILSFSQTVSASDAFEHIDLNILMHEVKQSLSDSIEKNNAVIRAEHLPKINAVPFQLLQLFINIIGNAIKYKKENVNPQIYITSKIINAKELNYSQEDLKGDYLQLSIKDNGIGFNAEYKEKIFELFKRLHAKEKYSGTGIGLSICKKIVYNHNGFIKAESEIGNGSSFHIFFPSDRIVSLDSNQIK